MLYAFGYPQSINNHCAAIIKYNIFYKLAAGINDLKRELENCSWHLMSSGRQS